MESKWEDRKEQDAVISNLSFEGEVIEIVRGKSILESRKEKFWFGVSELNVPVEHPVRVSVNNSF